MGAMAIVLVLSILCIPKSDAFNDHFPSGDLPIDDPLCWCGLQEEGTPPRTWKLNPGLEARGGELQKLDCGRGELGPAWSR